MNVEVEEAPLSCAYTFDGSLEGLFSAIFASYVFREDPIDIVSEDAFQPRLGQHTRAVDTNQEWALRVARGITKAGGRITFEAVRKASVAGDPAAGTIVYQFVRLLMRKRRYLLDDLANPTVANLVRLVRAVDNECERMRQFVRFSHLDNGGWFAVCNPRDNVVPLIMGWFAARFNDQPFAIYDEVHHVAGVYEGRDWYLVRTDSFPAPVYSEEEGLMQEAWRLFYRTLSIDARYNPELRRQHMPVRFWRNLTEMQNETVISDIIVSLPRRSDEK